MQDIFDRNIADNFIHRINQLTHESKPIWGKMNVAQMLAHTNVTYEFVYEPEKHHKPNAIKRFLIKLFAKPIVTGPKPYPKNLRTAPEFIITDERDFNKEKERLINFINKTQQFGRNYFDNKESFSFGKLSAEEWNTMFAKHLDHHLQQFGV